MIPGLLAYRAMLEKHPPLRTVLEDYYSDVLHFHEAALKVFTRPSESISNFRESSWEGSVIRALRCSTGTLADKVYYFPNSVEEGLQITLEDFRH